MPLNLLYTMVQKSQNWPKPQIKGGGGSCLNAKVSGSKRASIIVGLAAYLPSQRYV